ncbi:MAG: MoaD/ThiS family protein [Thermodesulfobacteriota bacterium]
MWVRLHASFGDGRTWDEIDLPSPASVPELLAILKQRYLRLEALIKPTPEETFHRFLLIRDDHVLSDRDHIAPDDRIVIMLPLTGG